MGMPTAGYEERRCNYQGRIADLERAVRTKLFAVRNSSKGIQEGNYGGLISGRQPTELANADSKLERPEKSQHPGLIGGRQPIELANGVRGLPCMSLDRFVESE